MLALLLASQLMACPVHADVLDAAAREVEARYVDALAAGSIAADLRRWAHDGRPGVACDDEAHFIEQLNRMLDTHDGHFHVEPVARSAEADDWLMRWRADAGPANAGIREVRVLEGNIGYLRISTFYDWSLAGAKLGHAWALLADTDALVLDLRQNGGGAADTPSALLAGFLGPDVRAVQDIERRSARTRDALPAPELPVYRRPLAVLVDARSASASEFLAYSLQAAKRATIIGSRTAGAAHLMGEPVTLPHGIRMTIPEGRPLNHATGGNWERRGVRPDVPGGDDPLYVAREHLRRGMEEAER